MTILETDTLQQRYHQVHKEELNLATKMLLGIDQIPESIDDVCGRLNQFGSYYVALALLLKQNNLEDLALYYQIESENFVQRNASLSPNGNGQLAYDYFITYRDDYLQRAQILPDSDDADVISERLWYLSQARIGNISASLIADEFKFPHQPLDISL